MSTLLVSSDQDATTTTTTISKQYVNQVAKLMLCGRSEQQRLFGTFVPDGSSNYLSARGRWKQHQYQESTGLGLHGQDPCISGETTVQGPTATQKGKWWCLGDIGQEKCNNVSPGNHCFQTLSGNLGCPDRRGTQQGGSCWKKLFMIDMEKYKSSVLTKRKSNVDNEQVHS